MKTSLSKLEILGRFLFSLWPLVINATVLSATANDPVLRAKQESESKGYVFLATHDEIVARAKKEGRLRALSGLSRSAMKPMVEAFKKNIRFLMFTLRRLKGQIGIAAGRVGPSQVIVVAELFCQMMAFTGLRRSILGAKSHA